MEFSLDYLIYMHSLTGWVNTVAWLFATERPFAYNFAVIKKDAYAKICDYIKETRLYDRAIMQEDFETLRNMTVFAEIAEPYNIDLVKYIPLDQLYGLSTTTGRNWNEVFTDYEQRYYGNSPARVARLKRSVNTLTYILNKVCQDAYKNSDSTNILSQILTELGLYDAEWETNFKCDTFMPNETTVLPQKNTVRILGRTNGFNEEFLDSVLGLNYHGKFVNEYNIILNERIRHRDDVLNNDILDTLKRLMTF